ncbi:MAG: RnfD, RnfE family, partial [Actinomycetota bacterium]
VLAAGTAFTSASGQCFTARWAFAPVCGSHLWLTIITSPEIFIFTYFMITDPRTVPQGRVGRVMFGAMVGVVCVLLMAPQSTEFGTKVALLSGLSVMTAVRPFLERFVPSAGADDDRLRVFARRVLRGDGEQAGTALLTRRTASVSVVVALMMAALSFGARSAEGILAGEPENLVGRMAERLDPATFPTITVDRAVTDWNHEIDVAGARQNVLTLAENLALENQALVERDDALLTAVAHGDRLEALRSRLADARKSGRTVLQRYRIDTVRVALLVPFGRQDGLSLGMVSRGTVTTETLDATGKTVASTTGPFETMWAMRRATGARWLTVAELPVSDAPAP